MNQGLFPETVFVRTALAIENGHPEAKQHNMMSSNGLIPIHPFDNRCGKILFLAPCNPSFTPEPSLMPRSPIASLETQTTAEAAYERVKTYFRSSLIRPSRTHGKCR